MRIAIIYDCWYPGTLGGAERWLDELARCFVQDGHDVDYVTLKFPDQHRVPYRVVTVGEPSPLYRDSGVRRTVPSIRYALEISRFLRRFQHQYDLVYVAQSPLWPVITATWAMRRHRERVVVEWLEWWSAGYWRAYLGSAAGTLGFFVQWLALKMSPRVVTYTQLTRKRVLRHKVETRIRLLPGMFPRHLCGGVDVGEVDGRYPPVLLYVGRLVPDKNPKLAVRAMALVRAEHPTCEAYVVGAGPLEEELGDLAENLGLGREIVKGPLTDHDLEALWRRASVLVHPSGREGYGLAVLEAAARGIPSALLGTQENAAVEFVVDGMPGAVCRHLDPVELAGAIEQLLAQGISLRRQVADWFEEVRDARGAPRTARSIIDWLGEPIP